MKINPKVVEYLRAVRVGEIHGVPYLLSLYFGYDPAYIPQSLKDLILSAGIIEKNSNQYTWKIPLFEGQEAAFDWVEKEYVALFERVGKGSHKREALTRMKELFRKNPDVRKDEVIGATELYLFSTDAKFVRLPHFFIQKGSGANKTEDILDWIDKYRLTTQTGHFDDTRKLQ